MFLELVILFTMCFVASIGMFFGLVLAEKTLTKVLPTGAVYGAGVIAVVRNRVSRGWTAFKNLQHQMIHGVGYAVGATTTRIGSLIPFRKKNQEVTVPATA